MEIERARWPSLFACFFNYQVLFVTAGRSKNRTYTELQLRNVFCASFVTKRRLPFKRSLPCSSHSFPIVCLVAVGNLRVAFTAAIQKSLESFSKLLVPKRVHYRVNKRVTVVEELAEVNERGRGSTKGRFTKIEHEADDMKR